jgi:hypothetical protein
MKGSIWIFLFSLAVFPQAIAAQQASADTRKQEQANAQ